MTKQLTTQDATITTAAVEVKALTISGRQVTQSVFRQLLEEPLIAEDGTLNGQPWGMVNYHPDRCGDRDPHWHVVWQKDDELRRSHVLRDFDGRRFSCMEGHAFLSAHIREVLEGRPRYFSQDMPTFDGGYGITLSKEADFPVYMQYDRSLYYAISAWDSLQRTRERYGEGDSEWAKGLVTDAEKKVAEEIEKLSSAPPEPTEVDELFAAYKASVQIETDRRQRHRDTRAALADLPQLFIAV